MHAPNSFCRRWDFFDTTSEVLSCFHIKQQTFIIHVEFLSYMQQQSEPKYPWMNWRSSSPHHPRATWAIALFHREKKALDTAWHLSNSTMHSSLNWNVAPLSLNLNNATKAPRKSRKGPKQAIRFGALEMTAASTTMHSALSNPNQSTDTNRKQSNLPRRSN